ncbi:hypothetical protein FB45DRAFT_1052215 [Roridomyces roridus]|uniref:F-box domain-containing protein n=1 Tax=Roridomyces roridus TaxID=1738132 RepID=A0AAD7CGB7_9AGAR|nr:hypothetical protein FB45DRAFT_1052215 [Roridomyces roridus]
MPKRRNQRKAPHVIYLDAVLDIPPELWEIIASSLPRKSLAALCLVCRQFCCIISAILYRDLSNPPLNVDQSSHLVETLSSEEALCCPAPSLLMRKLAFRQGHSDSGSKAAIEVLRGIASHPQGSVLRALHWDSMPGLDDLGRILLDQNHLPSLKELVVKCDARHVNNFNFIQSPGLQTLEFHLEFPDLYDEYELGQKMCYKLTEALPMLPSSSPLLHTFRFRITYPYYEDCFPHEAYSEFVATMNDSLLFPALSNLELAVDLRDYDYTAGFDPYGDDLPSTNFQEFLAANPSLSELTLSVPQTKCPVDVPLPLLRLLKGTFEFAAELLAGPAHLEKLDLTFCGPVYSEFPIFRTCAFAKSPLAYPPSRPCRRPGRKTHEIG